MERHIFANLPLANVVDSSAFYAATLGAGRDKVDRLSNIARCAGGRADPIPSQDYGVMYGRSFEDSHGRPWEAICVVATGSRERTQTA